MTLQRDIRRLAMQLLYQLDLRGEADGEAIAQSIDAEHDAAPVREAAWPLAQAAWAGREPADVIATELAPDWPTYRQPPIDRAILRLAYHEMTSGRTPVKVAINEAVELAKHYSTEQSPAFINGVLDKMAKRIAEGELKTAEQQSIRTADEIPGDDLWLADALAEDGARITPDSD